MTGDWSAVQASLVGNASVWPWRTDRRLRFEIDAVLHDGDGGQEILRTDLSASPLHPVLSYG
jgi:hypothetical protein